MGATAMKTRIKTIRGYVLLLIKSVNNKRNNIKYQNKGYAFSMKLTMGFWKIILKIFFISVHPFEVILYQILQ
ncbi:hypothetical protein EEL30_09120 [Brevibacillus laterosporus]|uniref:Uncharacterized protein n=1 Tax=Brevibacillus laterosporus TaxID=1465 RepID=A0A518V626_BRELA|nr:hypothetical protein EEL30_09120 [Brevibacillus laterosporus]